jgi:peroxiredoxin
MDGVYTVGLSKRFSQPVLKVVASGYLPVALTPPQEDRTDFAIALQSGQGPSGIVLLPDGKPAANVTVALSCAGHQGVCIRGGQVRISHAQHLVQTTDSGGAFSFLPELEMQTVVAASPDGFKLVSLPDLAANPKILLEPWGRVKGTLRRPSGPGIGEDLDLRFLPWMDAGTHATTDEDGRFEFERVPPGKMDLSYRVKSTGRGWQRVPLQSITVDPGQTLELNIEAPERVAPEPGLGFPRPRPERQFGPAITGTAVLPDGKPAAGIEVALVVPNEAVSLGKGSLQRGSDGRLRTRTDGAGHFTLPGVEGATAIVAVHEMGFATIDLPAANSPTLTLQLWGEIHGILRIGRRLGANESVSLARGLPGSGLMYGHDEFQTRTNDRGQFVITYVPPGEQSLVRWIPTGERSGTSSTPTFVNVKAGEVTEVTLGGSGRQVVGKAEFPDAPATFDWKEVKFSLHTTPLLEGQSKEARLKNRFYRPESATDGSFVFEDVPPGVYELSATVERTRHEGRNHSVNILPLGRKKITIPDAETGREGEPCDAGTLGLRLRQSSNVGGMAPRYQGETPDGLKFRLSDYRGKYVLLSVLSLGPECLAALPRLKAVFEAFGKDDRLAVLSVSRAAAPILKEFAQSNGITWTYGTLPTPPGTSVFADFFPSRPEPFSIQDTLLIDPEGKIVAKDLHGAAIEEAVAKALAKD